MDVCQDASGPGSEEVPEHHDADDANPADASSRDSRRVTDNRFYCLSGFASVTAWEPGCALGDIRPIRVLRIHVWKYRT